MIRFTWLKRYMPRSLFGRALLIMLVPLIALQLIVGAGFIQRHFDGVTRQLALGVALETKTIIADLERKGALSDETLRDAQALQLSLALDPDGAFEPGFRNDWYDLSGRRIKPTMETVLERALYIDLQSNFREVQIKAPTSAGVLSIIAPRKRMSTSNPHQLLVIMTFSALVLTLISVLFLRNQVRPITRLAGAAEAFGKGRNVPYRVSGADEVRRAGLEFLSMRQRIERHMEQRTLMLSGVSHDLRTPLTRMRLALATASEPEDLTALEVDISEMEAMIDSFIDFARDTSVEDAVLTDPVALLRSIIAETPGTADRVQFTASKTMRPREIPLRVSAFRRAVQNLLNNALRYGGMVEMSAAMSSRSLTICVEDDGPGIPLSERENAMRAFTRLDEARNQDAGAASGLGLAIVLDVARVHGGQLLLDDSKSLGGLKAVLTIPR